MNELKQTALDRADDSRGRIEVRGFGLPGHLVLTCGKGGKSAAYDGEDGELITEQSEIRTLSTIIPVLGNELSLLINTHEERFGLKDPRGGD